jgi:hypothetical protein
LIVAAGVAGAVYEWGPRPRPIQAPSEPTSPFLNTRPGVGYVGSARCADCHATEARTYAEHPMGRSVSPPQSRLPGQVKAAASFQESGLSYAVELTPDGARHREFARDAAGRVRAEVAVPIAFVVGSGRQGQSFLVNHDGYLFQSPVSWYSHRNAWRLAPGYARINEHFNRFIVGSCLFCHADGARPDPDRMNAYGPGVRPESIGCERCHGPGALHVAARERGDDAVGTDLTIVNPKHLEPALREAACQQCHLQGAVQVVRRGRSLADYRPGLPLGEFVSVFVHPPAEADPRKAVSHAEQMQQSRCFRASAGRLGCTSCHDPHVLPPAPERVAWYRGRCLSCHEDTSCTLARPERLRQNPADSCIDCHMPPGDGSNIAHSAITDHRIPRRPDPPGPAPAPEDPTHTSLVLFPPGESGAGDPRDLGLALAEVADRPYPEPVRRVVAHQAVGLLRGAVAAAPDDLAALEGLGIALWQDKNPQGALATLERVLQQAPRRELALEKAALVAMDMRDDERSLAYWRRRVEVNPYTAKGHAFLGQALWYKGQWAAAADECQASLRLDPFNHQTRMLLIDCLVRAGEKERARTEFETLLALRPSERDGLRRWFDELQSPRR